MAYLYPISLAALSALVLVAEQIAPWRKEQQALRPALGSDVFHLIFNGHFLGVFLFAIYTSHVHAHVVKLLRGVGLTDTVFANAALTWPVWQQIVVALLVVDFAQWCVHNVLHRVPALWNFHKVHHSVKTGEMDWIVSFRFHWMEPVIYKSALYLPLAFFGFGVEAILFHAIFGTLIGHLNHANLNISWGPLRYVLNSPRMHIWHHDYHRDGNNTVNFGIIFSIWDWLFRTAYLPKHAPERIGFVGEEEMPNSFLAHAVYPLLQSSAERRAGLATLAGGLVIASLYGLSAYSPSFQSTPIEESASSQPAVTTVASLMASNPDPDAALTRLGDDAKERGYAHPEWMASAHEIRESLGSKRLVLIDVRPEDRFLAGHIPSARNLSRSDYEQREPIPGLSRSVPELEAALRRVGVQEDSVVVLYGDGGPEPYRLWWTLREVAGYDTRVLDGGLAAYKALSLPTATNAPRPAPGDVVLGPPEHAPRLRWSDFSSIVEGESAPILLDTRSLAEYLGEEQHRNAPRKGRIPGATHLDWWVALRSPHDQRLRPVSSLRETFAALGLVEGTPIITHCQTGTRSAVTYFALLQAGRSDQEVFNYNGSWSEYARTSLPVETGPRG